MQTLIGNRIDNMYKRRVRWLEPFMSNHQISFELMASSPQEIKRVADLLAMNLAADSITARDKIVRIGMDTSPQRREALRT